MKSILKIAAASALVANSAFAMNFFAGGSFALTGNSTKTEVKSDGTDMRINLASFDVNLEGGAVFNLADSFDMTAEAFVGYNFLKTDKKYFHNTELTNGIAFGLQTKGMYAISDTTKLYGLAGIGMMTFGYKDGTQKESTNSVFAKVGLGAEFMVMDNLAMYTEFAFAMPFSKVEDKAKNLKYSLNQYQMRAGFRYFF